MALSLDEKHLLNFDAELDLETQKIIESKLTEWINTFQLLALETLDQVLEITTVRDEVSGETLLSIEPKRKVSEDLSDFMLKAVNTPALEIRVEARKKSAGRNLNKAIASFGDSIEAVILERARAGLEISEGLSSNPVREHSSNLYWEVYSHSISSLTLEDFVALADRLFFELKDWKEVLNFEYSIAKAEFEELEKDEKKCDNSTETQTDENSENLQSKLSVRYKVAAAKIPSRLMDWIIDGEVNFDFISFQYLKNLLILSILWKTESKILMEVFKKDDSIRTSLERKIVKTYKEFKSSFLRHSEEFSNLAKKLKTEQKFDVTLLERMPAIMTDMMLKFNSLDDEN